MKTVNMEYLWFLACKAWKNVKSWINKCSLRNEMHASFWNWKKNKIRFNQRPYYVLKFSLNVVFRTIWKFSGLIVVVYWCLYQNANAAVKVLIGSSSLPLFFVVVYCNLFDKKTAVYDWILFIYLQFSISVRPRTS